MRSVPYAGPLQFNFPAPALPECKVPTQRFLSMDHGIEVRLVYMHPSCAPCVHCSLWEAFQPVCCNRQVSWAERSPFCARGFYLEHTVPAARLISPAIYLMRTFLLRAVQCQD